MAFLTTDRYSDSCTGRTVGSRGLLPAFGLGDGASSLASGASNEDLRGLRHQRQRPPRHRATVPQFGGPSPRGGQSQGRRILLHCPGPSLERTRPLKECLEALGATILVHSDSDLLSCAELAGAEVGSPTSSSVGSWGGSCRDYWAPPRPLEGAWRRPGGGAQAGSGAPSPERAPEPARERSPRPLEVPFCDAVLVVWSQFFQGALQGRLRALTERASARGALMLNDMRRLVEMQDRRWLLRKLREHGIPTPHFVECSRDGSHEPDLEENCDCIVVDGQRINKPFVEKPVDRRDRDIYVYFPKRAGGGRALVTTQESGDVEYVCCFDSVSRIRREGSFVYQEYLQSDGLAVQAVCCGGQAYGNVVQMFVTAPEPFSSLSGAGTTPVQCDWASASPVLLRQEEKLIAKKLSVIMHQTLFGLTFARAQRGSGELGKVTSYVVDVWPGVPRCGFGVFAEDVGRAILAAMGGRLPTRGCLTRSRSQPSEERSPAAGAFEASTAAPPIAAAGGAGGAPGEPEEDALCVLLVCGHGETTPKQKLRARLELASEFAAGWLCGWLAGARFEGAEVAEPPPVLELRAPDQLSRLSAAVRKLEDAGHPLGVFGDAVANADMLGEACHAKLHRDRRVLQASLKWGGELTEDGIEASEAFGATIRQEMCADIDVGSVRHDTKVYSSREPRCQQTAAAFCKGLLRLNAPALPPIIAALVRVDEVGSLEAGDKGSRCRGKGGEGTPGSGAMPRGQCSSLDTPWVELEALVGKVACRAAVASPALAPFGAPGPALRELRRRMEKLQAALNEAEKLSGGLYNDETLGMLRQRYSHSWTRLQLGEDPNSLNKVPKILDHLAYDRAHNCAVFPTVVREAFDEALPLCEALCDVRTALDVAHRASEMMHRAEREPGGRDDLGVRLLRKLRWDLRVASGVDLGAEKAHLAKHEHLYGAGCGVDKPCVRTRLYFSHDSHLQSLLIALSQPRRCGGAVADDSAQLGAAETTVATRLGFLAHFAIRLCRRRSSGELRVACHFGREGKAEKVCLFDLALVEVDAWFTELLAHAEEPSQVCFPDPAPQCPGG